ncbi:hypothetical protein FB567DRAFT_544885 [Paraphoma chrysanthemicola]|uniref:Uncharacterized protein n=1 Tax=Paraphoma chrysanthemicola TaxID=798071 RepID=A0A8K0W4A5_9PLEO|nr:hypothetical protein FB567DRAFT_544885 [Paraphoma chrysanthemicola]
MTESFGCSFLNGDRPRTRTSEEALGLHEIAARNLEHIFKHARSMTKPSMTAIYLEHAHATCAPSYLDLDVLFKTFDRVARANFVAHQATDYITNSLILYYGMDKLYSFNSNLDQSRLNLTLAIFKWARKLISKPEDLHDPSHDFWYTYILAWMGSVLPGGGFDKRHAFLQEWSTSRYDLAWFTRKHRAKMHEALEYCGSGKAPIDGDAKEYIDRCARGDMSLADFERIGPAMAIHFLLSFRVKKEVEEDEMMTDAEQYPVPEGIDLTRVNWDADWMQALLNVDVSLQKVDGRPVTDRIPWIDQEVACRTLYTKGDELADKLSKLLCL